jgi:hypothetical protein
MQVHIFGKKCTSHKNEELNIDKKNVNKEEEQDNEGPVATLLWPSVGVKPNTWKKLGLELSQP